MLLFSFAFEVDVVRYIISVASISHTLLINRLQPFFLMSFPGRVARACKLKQLPVRLVGVQQHNKVRGCKTASRNMMKSSAVLRGTAELGNN